MILNLYALKNRLSGVFERPFAEIYDSKEYPELLVQTLAMASVDDLNRHKEFDLYCLGTFDSKSGECRVAAPEFIVSLESICLSYIEKKGLDNHVGSERVESV